MKWIIGEIIGYYDKYHTTPTMEVLKVELQKVDNEVLQISIRDTLKKAYTSSTDDLDYVQEEFTNFCKNQQLKSALMSSVDMLKAGDYDGIRYLIDDALKAGQDKNIGHEYGLSITDRYREENRVTIPTPWDTFNTLLQGGLGNGDLGIIFGNPGGGKSWTLVALGGHAARLGYNVLHYTLELGEGYVGIRYDSYFTGIDVSQIRDHKDRVEEVIPEIPGNIVIKEYPTGRAKISTIESHISKCESMGIKPDLIIIDYLDLLTSGKKSKDRKADIDDVYLDAKGLAKQLQLPVWTVSQVNRSGYSEDVIEGDKAAGSYDKVMIADFAASLSRKAEDKENGTGRFHIMKNRYGWDGMTYKAKADTSRGWFEILDAYTQDDNQGEALVSPLEARSSEVFDKSKLKDKFFNIN